MTAVTFSNGTGHNTPIDRRASNAMGCRLTAFALKNAAALIESVFPAQKVSFEAQRERKAGAGQTLTVLGSYWKGRKPLILVRGIVLGCLLPVTEDPEADLEIFEKLMAFDLEGLARRGPKISPAEIASRSMIPGTISRTTSNPTIQGPEKSKP